MTHITNMYVNLKGQGHQATLGGCSRVTTCKGWWGISWRTHYRLHSLFLCSKTLHLVHEMKNFSTKYSHRLQSLPPNHCLIKPFLSCLRAHTTKTLSPF